MDEIKIKLVPTKPRFVLIYKGKEITYYWKSFNKVMCWKNKNNAKKFIEENTFIDEQGTEVNKKNIMIIELKGENNNG